MNGFIDAQKSASMNFARINNDQQVSDVSINYRGYDISNV